MNRTRSCLAASIVCSIGLLTLPPSGDAAPKAFPTKQQSSTTSNTSNTNKQPTITPEQMAFFEKKIRPLLVSDCYKCHSAESEKIKGSLVVDTREGLLKGGDTGPAIVPGNPSKSLLIKAIKGDDKDLQMPPKKKLAPEVVADFEKWITMGAPDPRSGKSVASAAKKKWDTEQAKHWWSFQLPKKSALPPVSDAKWPRTDIDNFVLAKLEENHLTPAPDADKRTLIRRVYYDLTGLPPSAEEVQAFVNDGSTGAFEALVDRLLASPQFGEKWGRHWLDVARYAESSGKERNIAFPHAWRYRDYVVEAFNTDKPYNRFLIEQIAGDLLPASNPTVKAKHQIATGFLAIGPKSVNTRDARQFHLDIADEQIDAVGQAMLGITVACARCHDHKFDPIAQKDYYGIAGIFMSTETCFGGFRTLGIAQASSVIELPDAADVPTAKAITHEQRKKLLKQREEAKKTADDMMKDLRTAKKNRDAVSFARFAAARGRVEQLDTQLNAYHDDGSPKKLAMGVREGKTIGDIPIYSRGEIDKPGDKAPRGFVQVISKSAPAIGPKESGRLELARWIASPDNPLTARVIVNRIWQHLMGKGIVTSVDNFGTMGQKPTHPELLDYLAVTFMENRWSIKKMVKQVVMSRSYQMSSDYSASNDASDPDNTWLWRHDKRRLDAEEIRDSMLLASGQLDLKPPVASPMESLGEGFAPLLFAGAGMGNVPRFLLNVNSPRYDANGDTHRSVYMPVVRDMVVEPLAVFDFAEPSLVTGHRAQTSVPSQALYMMNSTLALKTADAMARRIMAENDKTPVQKITLAFQLAFGRGPSADELRAADGFFKSFIPAQGSGALRAGVDGWTAFCQALLASAEFRYVN
jgi:hypothetical protein